MVAGQGACTVSQANVCSTILGLVHGTRGNQTTALREPDRHRDPTVVRSSARAPRPLPSAPVPCGERPGRRWRLPGRGTLRRDRRRRPRGSARSPAEGRSGFFTACSAAAGDLAPPPTTEFRTVTVWAVLSGIGSHGLYYLVTTRDRGARASTLLYLTPAATTLWATLMFGQPLRHTTVIGLLVTTVAVVGFNAASRLRTAHLPRHRVNPPHPPRIASPDYRRKRQSRWSCGPSRPTRLGWNHPGTERPAGMRGVYGLVSVRMRARRSST